MRTDFGEVNLKDLDVDSSPFPPPSPPPSDTTSLRGFCLLHQIIPGFSIFNDLDPVSQL